jgi:Family of unknown function (DUF6084)
VTSTTAIPALDFAVEGARCVTHAAAPTIGFDVRVSAPPGVRVQSVVLDVQVQIAARRRRYGAGSHERLGELFGPPSSWSTTLRTLLWTRTTLVVPAFAGATRVLLPVTCTYDLEVSSARYLHGLDDGDVPLEFLFSGTVFAAGEGGRLQATRLAWDREAELRMPVAVWRETMERYFPNTAWLRVEREVFDRLVAFRARRGLPTWDAALGALLEEEA